MNRRSALGLGAAAAAGALLGYGRWVEPGDVAFTRHVVRLSREGAWGAVEGGVEGEAPAGVGVPARPPDTLRIVQLSDLHLKRVGPPEAALADSVDALAADLLVLTGDAIDDVARLGLLGEFLSLLRSRAACLAVMGNWEYQGGVGADALARELARGGGELLVDRSVTVALRGGELEVTGLDDGLRGRPDPARALRTGGGAARRRGHHLVLAHCPFQRETLSEATSASGGAPPPWILSGHTHGGQVGIGRLRVTPRGSGRYLRGWYRDGLPHLYVSRGVGTSLVPIRIGARPEVATFDVTLA